MSITRLTNVGDHWEIFDLGEPQVEVGTRFIYRDVEYETVTRSKGFILVLGDFSMPAGGIFPDGYPSGAVAARLVEP